jgi:hypothetical protein
MTDTTPVPSREAVEAYFKRGPKDGMFTAWVAEGHAMLRTLHKEVERLNLLNTHLDRAATTIGKKCDALRATVAEQGAALVELEKDMRNSIAHDGYRTVSTRCAPYTMVEEWSDRITALARAQSSAKPVQRSDCLRIEK